ncbi:MAG: GTPase ObgE [bacterium]|nr:GTPase ObgE [bacterium]
MFIDEVTIKVKGGDGGPGALSFHREKYLPKGGPDGGDGGKGGDVYVIGDENLETLNFYRSKKKLIAQSGSQGQGNKKSGKDGVDLYIRVPLGTCVYNTDTGRFLGEILLPSDKLLVARGGRGGRGNSNFLSNKYRAPQVAEKGEMGEEVRITLVLKAITDVAIIGLPNSGKSTLLSLLTNAKPKIAEYPFTTTEPVFGTFDTGLRLIKLVEIPAIIEGSYKGLGLGNKFLKHAERASLLILLLEKEKDLEIIKTELSFYSDNLLTKDIIIFYKDDIYDTDKLETLKNKITDMFTTFRYSTPISLEEERLSIEMESLSVKRIGETFYVFSKDLAKDLRRIDFTQRDHHLLLNPLIRRYGLLDALKRSGAKEGDKVIIEGVPFIMLEERIKYEF